MTLIASPSLVRATRCASPTPAEGPRPGEGPPDGGRAGAGRSCRSWARHRTEDGRSPRWPSALVGVGLAVAVAVAGALWIFAATFYGQMQKTSDWHMAGPTEAMMFAEDHGIDLYAPGVSGRGRTARSSPRCPTCAPTSPTRTPGSQESTRSMSRPALRAAAGPGATWGATTRLGARRWKRPRAGPSWAITSSARGPDRHADHVALRRVAVRPDRARRRVRRLPAVPAGGLAGRLG